MTVNVRKQQQLIFFVVGQKINSKCTGGKQFNAVNTEFLELLCTNETFF